MQLLNVLFSLVDSQLERIVVLAELIVSSLTVLKANILLLNLVVRHHARRAVTMQVSRQLDVAFR